MVNRYHTPPSQRQLRVSEEIRTIVSELIIRKEVHIPNIEGVIITVPEVRISADLVNATVFLTVINSKDDAKITLMFNQISPQIRKYVSSHLRLRFAPELRFVIDDSSANAAKIEDLFKKI